MGARIPITAVAMASLLLAGAAGPALAGKTNPAIQLDQVGVAKPVSAASVRIDNVNPPRGNLTVTPIPADAQGRAKTSLDQPQAALDRCEAILLGRAPAVEGLDCSQGQFERLRRIVSEEAQTPPPPTVDVDSLAKDLESTGRAPDGIDPTTGVPSIMILQPRG